MLQLYLGPNKIWFIPKTWMKNMPPCSNRWKFLSKPYPIAFWFVFSSKRSRIGLILEVGSLEDSKKRLKLINTFQDKGFKIGKMGFRKEAKFTRVHSIYRNLSDPDDHDEMEQQIVELWKKSKDTFDLASSIIDSFKWS
jgi:hypothetical protein